MNGEAGTRVNALNRRSSRSSERVQAEREAADEEVDKESPNRSFCRTYRKFQSILKDSLGAMEKEENFGLG